MPVETRVELGDRAANDDKTLVAPHEQGVPCKQDLEKRLSARHVEGQPCLPALALALVKWSESRATSPEFVRDTEAQQPTRRDYIMIHARWIIERQSANHFIGLPPRNLSVLRFCYPTHAQYEVCHFAGWGSHGERASGFNSTRSDPCHILPPSYAGRWWPGPPTRGQGSASR